MEVARFASDVICVEPGMIRTEFSATAAGGVTSTAAKVAGSSRAAGERVLRRRVHRLVLVSATTQGAAIGLRAEPHFLYATLEGIIGTMNENRLKDLVMPLLGAGHGAMPVSIALLFDLLALRSIRIRDVRIVSFPANAAEITNAELDALIARVA
jgi:hypothetical protein